MKPETEPVAPDEWLIRLVWEDRVTDGVPVISPNAFEPRKNETDGISFFRRDCLNEPSDALFVIPEEKRSRYAIVLIPVSQLASLNLSVQPAKIDTVRSSHCVDVRELVMNLFFRWRSICRESSEPVRIELADDCSNFTATEKKYPQRKTVR